MLIEIEPPAELLRDVRIIPPDEDQFMFQGVRAVAIEPPDLVRVVSIREAEYFCERLKNQGIDAGARRVEDVAMAVGDVLGGDEFQADVVGSIRLRSRKREAARPRDVPLGTFGELAALFFQESVFHALLKTLPDHLQDIALRDCIGGTDGPQVTPVARRADKRGR